MQIADCGRSKISICISFTGTGVAPQNDIVSTVATTIMMGSMCAALPQFTYEMQISVLGSFAAATFHCPPRPIGHLIIHFFAVYNHAHRI